MRYWLLCLFLLLNNAYADEFSELVAKTSSVYSTVADIDASNAHEMGFETLLTNQRVYLSSSATHLNSSFYTIINSDESLRKKMAPPTININNLLFKIDGSATPTSTCDGSTISGTETSCTSEECTIAQRIISACNASNCWATDSSTDRTMSATLSEKYSLTSKVEITDCIPNNTAGEKHAFGLTVQNQAVNILNGGSVQYSLILFNDVVSSKKRFK